MPVIPALEMGRQEKDHKFKVLHPWLSSELKARVGHMSSYLKIK